MAGLWISYGRLSAAREHEKAKGDCDL